MIIYMNSLKLLNFEESIYVIKKLLENEHLEFTFKGSSMLPTIKPGTRLVVSGYDKLTIGKIYVYIDRDPDSISKIVCHRLYKVNKPMYYFKGDNRRNIDNPIGREDIIGEVVYWN